MRTMRSCRSLTTCADAWLAAGSADFFRALDDLDVLDVLEAR
jgi:hypothetical protein